MEKKINVAELLKDCPKGMELDSPLFENLIFDRINEDSMNGYPIHCHIKCDNGTLHSIFFTKDGREWLHPHTKCVLFPKGKTTWEGFVPPCQFKDGDIVAIDSNKGAQVFIFKEYIVAENNYARCYMMLDDDGVIGFRCSGFYVDRLATEEEKEKLFQAIKDNGYKWNKKTKTLERLIKPKFKVGDRIKNKNTGICDIVIKVYEDCYLVTTCLDEQATISFNIQDNWELVPNKFDITTLKPFESKVLVRARFGDLWKPAIFGCTIKKDYAPYVTLGGVCWAQCIPYEGNHHLLGKTDDCDEFYKTWE